MAVKISQMTPVSSISGTELLEVVQGGVTKSCTALQLLQNPTNPGNAAGVVYNPSGTGAVATNVQAVLRNTLSITDFGAVGDDATDNQTFITNAAAAAKAGNKALYVPPGIFRHSGAWTIDSIIVYGPGTLKATDTTASNPNHAVIMIGTGTELRDVTLTTTWAGARQSNDNSCCIVLNTCSRFAITNVKMLAAAGAAVISNGSFNGRIDSNYVTGTLADGIHMTGGSHDIVISNNTCIGLGDDCIATVGYLGQGQPFGILITGNRLYGGQARGVGVVGAAKITVTGNHIERSLAAGIYVASESSFTTYACNDILVDDNHVIDCNTSGTIAHGGILLSGYTGQPITNIEVLNNAISWTGGIACPLARGIVARDGAFIVRPKIKNNTINGSPQEAIDVGCVSPEVVGNSVYNGATHGIVLNAECSGVPIVAGNTIYNSNTTNTAAVGHIDVEPSTATRYIINNNVITDGTNVPDGGAIRSPVVGRWLIARKGNVYNGTPMQDWVAVPKASTTFTYTLGSSADSGVEEVNDLRMESGETLKFVVQGKRHTPVRFSALAVRTADMNQWAEFDERWNYTTAAGVGTTGVNFVTLTGATRYQRTSITTASSGTSVSVTMTVDGSDNVTITFTAAAQVNIRATVRYAYKAA